MEKPTVLVRGHFDVLKFLDQVTENTSFEFALTVIEAMQLYSNELEVQIGACSAIQRLARKEDSYRELLLDLGAGKLILEALDMFPSIETLHESACASINNLCISESNRRRLMEIGAGQAINRVMIIHMDKFRVQEKAVAAIKALAYCESNRQYLIKLNVGETLLKVMSVHKYNLRIQEQACGAFHCLTHLESCREGLTDLGLGEALLTAMGSFYESVYLQENACAALTNLALIEVCAIRLMDCGIAPVVLRIMRLHYREENCQLFGVLLILVLTCHNRQYVEAFIQAGAPERVRSAMIVFPNNIQILEKGQQLLTKFTTRITTAIAA